MQADSTAHLAPAPGNEEVRRRLADLALRERLHPCLLFQGPRGTGKAHTALWLARLCNCDAAPELRPCEECWSCRSIPRDQHPDILRVGLDPSKTAPVISVAQAREVIEKLVLRPYNARRRFVIIDPADALTIPAANALLKTFEEPPEATGFVLITSTPSRLLATVRSRSQRLRFAPVSLVELTRWLTDRGVGDPAWIARLADGCPGRAVELAEGEALAQRELRDECLNAIRQGSEAIFAFSQSLSKGSRADSSAQLLALLESLAQLVRDTELVVARQGLDAARPVGPGELYNPDLVDLINAWAASLGHGGVANLDHAIVVAQQSLDAFVSGRLIVDTLLFRFANELGAARTAFAAG